MSEAASSSTHRHHRGAHPKPDSAIRRFVDRCFEPGSAWRHVFAGAIGGGVATAILSPLDVVRTRLQAHQTSVKMRPDRMILHIARTEGILGLYRGLVPAILGDGPARALYFGFQNRAKRLLGPDGYGWSGAKLHLSSALIAGFGTNTIMSPWWVIRLRLQLQTTPIEPLWPRLRAQLSDAVGMVQGLGRPRQQPLVAAAAASAELSVGASATAVASAPSVKPHGGYKGIVDCVVRMYREEGARSFYKGLTASYLGVSEYFLFFGAYGVIKDLIIERRVLEIERGRDAAAAARSATSSASAAPANNLSNAAAAADVVEIDALELAQRDFASSTWSSVISACTKAVASAATYPIDVIRTRLRQRKSDPVKYSGILQSFRTILVEEGVRGLYGGLSVHLLRTVPNAAILMTIVEYIVGGDV